MTELALIERIAARTTTRPGTTVGIGDDAALIELGDTAVVTHDMLVEDVHFRLATIGFEDLGAKAVAVNLSDLAAMGVDPVAIVVGLGLPSGFSATGGADAISIGIEAMAARHEITVAGGDITLAPVVVIGVTAIGRPAPGIEPLRRSGAVAGDLLCVTGPLGASAAGLCLLEDPALLPGLLPRSALVGAHLRPVPRLTAGRILAGGGARAMLDLSDGLAMDAARLARASGLRARVQLSAVPLAAGVAEVARALHRSPALLGATGGEDYELLVAVPPDRLEPLRRALDVPLIEVGALGAGAPGLDLVGESGVVVPVSAPGWEHDV